MKEEDWKGAHHLSKNTYVHHYSEGPAERLNGFLTDFMAMSGNAVERQQWLNGKAKRTDSRLGQIFNHEETIEYLVALRDFRPHFNDDNIFSAQFCVKQLHNVNGGVSGSSVMESKWTKETSR
jgi:hypothetical protein